MIDTHCHLTYKPLAGQLEAVLDRAAQAGVTGMISVGTSPADALAAAELAGRCERVWASAGLHPHYAAQWPDRGALMAALGEALRKPKMVAVGEMGLDRHYSEPTMDVQRRVLGWQLEAMRETSLPGIIHNREATGDVLNMLRDSGVPAHRFVFHCFTGEAGDLDAIMDFGAMVGFTGIVTFKNSQALADLAARVPLQRMLVETDAPYLTPVPHRKVKVNEPGFIPDTVRFLAQIRQMKQEEMVATLDGNARHFFALDKFEQPAQG